MTTGYLRAIHGHDPEALSRAVRAARAARIDKLGVDRSSLDVLATVRWARSDAWDARETRLAARRADLTLADRMAAWRGLFARVAR